MSKFTPFQIDSQANNHNYKTAEFTSEYHILSLSGGKDSTALACTSLRGGGNFLFY